MKARDYFDNVAGRYQDMTSSNILGKIRNNEAKSVMKLLDPQKGENILDAGCGAGFYSLLIKERGATPFGIDISSKMVDETKKQGVEAGKHDLENLDLGKNFDKIVCAGALEFCTAPKEAVKNLSNHLAEEGHIIFLFPKLSITGLLYKLYHLSHGVIINLFTVKKVEQLLNKAELEISSVETPTPFSCVLKATNKKKSRKYNFQPHDYYYRAYHSKTTFTHYFHKHRIDKIRSFVHTQKTVLDAGCGSGTLLSLLSKNGHKVTGVDIVNEQVKFASKICPDGEFHCIDLRKLNLKKQFDIVICSEVIEHFDKNDREIVLTKLSKHVRKGGYLILTFPSEYYLFIEIFWKRLRKILYPQTIFDDENLHERVDLNEILDNLKQRNYSIKKIDRVYNLVTYVLAIKNK